VVNELLGAPDCGIGAPTDKLPDVGAGRLKPERDASVTQSMTGFARHSVTTDTVSVTVEMRSVNNRFLDLQFKCPDFLRPLEGGWRACISEAISRGKIDVLVRAETVERESALELDAAHIAALQSALKDIHHYFPEAAKPDQLELLRSPGVLLSGAVDETQWKEAGDRAISQSLAELLLRRREEGAKLAEVIRSRRAEFGQYLVDFKTLLPALRQAQTDRLMQRLAQAGIEPDAKRLEEELVYSAQKSDVDEELERLMAHLEAIDRALEGTAPCGRRLDFLMQELNREANTLASKATALATTQTAVEFKVLIEQMREQIQNIE